MTGVQNDNGMVRHGTEQNGTERVWERHAVVRMYGGAAAVALS